jgi:hypothetical protein
VNTSQRSTWGFFFLLLQFIEQNGHARVPMRLKTKDGFNIGNWVQRQRKTKEKMTLDRIEKLELLESWVWKLKK